MKKIHILNNNMINKIAAGEVVERPLSVIKELVENSIDAKATDIIVEIKNGGTSYIRVTDNGVGIPKEDIRNAFLRHATSKIENLTDLENVLTLGFRGEALSSISSVSKLEMVTKTKNETTGIRIELSGEEIISENEIGAIEGTSIIVRNLFFNVPARRKFLKKIATESGYVSDIINKLALGHPNISFKYINNNSTILQTTGTKDLKTCIYQIFGKDVGSKIIPVEYSFKKFSIDGFIGKPEIARNNRKYQNLFINGRYIKNKTIESAVESAYGSKLFSGKFPFFVLNVQIEPDKIDVNVHPTKLEVRFEDEDFIYNSVFEAIEKTLKQENLIPEAKLTKESFFQKTNTKPLEISKDQKVLSDLVSFQKEKSLEEHTSMNESILKPYTSDEPIPKPKFSNDFHKPAQKSFDIKNETNINEKEKSFNPFFKNYTIVGQIFGTYWIVAQNDCMYMIDQHAAHERIIYEKLLNQFRNQTIDSQRLIEPFVLKLLAEEYQIILDNMDMLNDFGFELEKFEENTFAIRSVPIILSNPENLSFFNEIIDKLSNISTSIDNIYETKLDNIAMISCKAAIKGNYSLTYQEAKALIEKLLKIENPFTCPHGRPTIIELTKYEIERKFKRV